MGISHKNQLLIASIKLKALFTKKEAIVRSLTQIVLIKIIMVSS